MSVRVNGLEDGAKKTGGRSLIFSGFAKKIRELLRSGLEGQNTVKRTYVPLVVLIEPRVVEFAVCRHQGGQVRIAHDIQPFEYSFSRRAMFFLLFPGLAFFFCLVFFFPLVFFFRTGCFVRLSICRPLLFRFSCIGVQKGSYPPHDIVFPHQRRKITPIVRGTGPKRNDEAGNAAKRRIREPELLRVVQFVPFCGQCRRNGGEEIRIAQAERGAGASGVRFWKIPGYLFREGGVFRIRDQVSVAEREIGTRITSPCVDLRTAPFIEFGFVHLVGMDKHRNIPLELLQDLIHHRHGIDQRRQNDCRDLRIDCGRSDTYCIQAFRLVA